MAKKKPQTRELVAQREVVKKDDRNALPHCIPSCRIGGVREKCPSLETQPTGWIIEKSKMVLNLIVTRDPDNRLLLRFEDAWMEEDIFFI